MVMTRYVVENGGKRSQVVSAGNAVDESLLEPADVATMPRTARAISWSRSTLRKSGEAMP